MTDTSTTDDLNGQPVKLFFTIREVDSLCGVKPYVLRYWQEEFRQLAPQRSKSGRRMYRGCDLLLIRHIACLLHDKSLSIGDARARIDAEAAEEALKAIPARDGFDIDEASDLCRVEPNVLRYWELDFPQLAPIKRMGYRCMYLRQDLMLARQIRRLLADGCTVRDARARLHGIDACGSATVLGGHEVSALFELAPHVLRTWEREIPQLYMIWQGNTDEYQPHDVDLIREIVAHVDEGRSIDEVRVTLDSKAAAHGDVPAQRRLAAYYAHGKGAQSPHATELATGFYRMAAESGNVEAQFEWANMNRGTDDAAAFHWCAKAAHQGLAAAQFELAEMYGLGQGIAGSNDAAFLWYGKAANQGMAQAQFQLAGMYASRMSPQDHTKAIEWFTRAANKGYVPAQLELGCYYKDGQGIAVDEHQAVYWFTRAAMAGQGRAQGYLGYMYVQGKGVPQDHVRGYAWWVLSAGQGDRDAKRDLFLLRKRMTAEQIEQGYALSQTLLTPGQPEQP